MCFLDVSYSCSELHIEQDSKLEVVHVYAVARNVFLVLHCSLLCRWYGVVSGWEHSLYKFFCFGSQPNCITLLLGQC